MTGFRTLAFVLPLVLFLVKDSHGRNIVRSRSGNLTDIAASRPVLSRDRLHEVRLYDRMKCFPKVLCTLTKSGAFTKLGRVSLNDLADGYLRLLTAFPGGPPMDLGEDNGEKFKHDFESQIVSNSQPSVQHGRDDDDEEEDDDDDDGKTRDEKDSKELLLSDPLLHHKEKLEMQKLMEELMEEEKTDALKKKPSSWTSSAMSLPFQLGSSLLKEVVLPYFVGDSDRSGRDLGSYFLRRNTDIKERKERGVDVDKNQDPIATAMARWNKLKSPQQCSKLFTACPFEAWEIISMIKLIKKS